MVLYDCAMTFTASTAIKTSGVLDDVKYEIRGQLARRAVEMEKRGYEHVLVTPGSSFNTPYSDHFRITTLPDPDVIRDVFSRIESVLGQHS